MTTFFSSSLVSLHVSVPVHKRYRYHYIGTEKNTTFLYGAGTSTMLPQSSPKLWKQIAEDLSSDHFAPPEL